MASSSSPPNATTSGNSSPGGGGGVAALSSEEENLRRQLREALQNLNRREPLDTTYKRLLLGGSITRRCPVLPRDKFYKRIGSNIRQRVELYQREIFGKDPFDRISQRQPLEEDKMRDAFRLREAKEHEQVPLLEATLASATTMVSSERKRHLAGIVMALQSREKPNKIMKTAETTANTINSSTNSNSNKTSDPNEAIEQARRKAEIERQRVQAREWEEARAKREEEERLRKERELIRERRQQQALQQQNPQQVLIEQVFRKLWEMDFVVLGGTNPFRIVIDRENCASIGAPDYFQIITTPMNLTYIKDKVYGFQYSTLQSFFADVDLMIQNAITYNSDQGNPYRIAAEEMKKRCTKIQKRVWQQIQQRQHQQSMG